MLKMHLAAGLAATALMTAAAVAQTPPASSAGGATATQAPVGAGQVMTQMPPDLMRGSKLMGVDVYGSDNEKIGDVDEVLLDREGKIRGIVVGVGGFLGIGQKDVAIPYDQVQWMSAEQAQTASNTQGGGSGTNTAGGVTAPANPAGTTGGTTASTTNQPATTGSTGGTAGTSGARSNDNTPARAMVRMTKADLQNAPEFRYSMNEGGSNAAGGASGTNPPAANRPAAPQ